MTYNRPPRGGGPPANPNELKPGSFQRAPRERRNLVNQARNAPVSGSSSTAPRYGYAAAGGAAAGAGLGAATNTYNNFWTDYMNARAEANYNMLQQMYGPNGYIAMRNQAMANQMAALYGRNPYLPQNHGYGHMAGGFADPNSLFQQQMQQQQQQWMQQMQQMYGPNGYATQQQQQYMQQLMSMYGPGGNGDPSQMMNYLSGTGMSPAQINSMFGGMDPNTVMNMFGGGMGMDPTSIFGNIFGGFGTMMGGGGMCNVM